MRGKLVFLGGLAAGFVLGSRAGRQAYDDLVSTARKVKDSPTVQEAAGVVQAQATKLYEQGKETVTDRFAHTRLGDRLMHQNAEPMGVGAGSSVNASGGKPKGGTGESGGTATA
jgi:hypothetical protein